MDISTKKNHGLKLKKYLLWFLPTGSPFHRNKPKKHNENHINRGNSLLFWQFPTFTPVYTSQYDIGLFSPESKYLFDISD